MEIRRFWEKHPELEFILGVGWTNPCFGSHGPAKELLDEITKEIPMAFDSSDHHSIWANSKAIELAGITAQTPDPEGGVIERRENGEPSGTFREAAQDLIRPICPEFTVEQYKEDVPLYMVKHQVRPGITGWAQINGLRGDTSIKARVEHDIYYIEHWSLMFDIEILLATVFKGKFMNSEVLS